MSSFVGIFACGASPGEGTGGTDPDSGAVPDSSLNGGDGGGASGECVGKADGTACGNKTATECDLADVCKAGACVANFVAEGNECGAAATSCTAKGTCDGKGKCSGAPKAAGTACGDTATTECSAPDSCDGNGACAANHKANGTACGDATDVQCNRPDACDNGTCKPMVADEGAFCQDCAAGVGKCGLCASGACPNLCESPTLSSTETSFGGGNSQNGNMFDVVAQKDVLILGVDVSQNSTNVGPVEIYTHVGALDAAALTTAGLWTKRASTTAPAATGRQALDGDVFVPLLGGATTSLYVTHTTGALLNYTNGSAVGTSVSNDGTLDILEGYGKSYPFGSSFSPRIWNGALRYVVGASTSYAGGATGNGSMFDVKATNTTSIRAVSANLPVGEHTMHVYFHPGTHVGTEGTASAWTQLGGDLVVTSAAEGQPTAIPLKFEVTIPAGKSYAFYVTTTGATSMNSTAGTAVGALASPAGDVEVYEGASVAYPFGAKTSPSKFNGSVYFGNCL